MSPRRLQVPSLALAATLLLLAAGCGGDDEETPSASAPSSGSSETQETQKVELLLPYQESIFFLGELMAQAKGYFAEEGLEVEALPSDGGGIVVQQLIAGKVKFAVTSPEPLMIAASKGAEIRGVAETDRGTIQITAPSDGAQSLEDLRGKKLGITEAGGGEVGFVKLVLEKAGLTDDVELLPVGAGGPAVYHALKNGRIAAYSGFTNDIAGVAAAGLELTNILPEEYAGLPSDEFAVMQETLDDPADREIAIKIMRAWNKGTQFALENPEEALELACERVPEECQDEKIAQAFMDVSLGAVKPREGMDLGAHDYDAYKIVEDGLVAAEQMPKRIDLQAVFPDDLVSEMAP
jgi:NitT/TauT family transport system substrate-binding protein